MMYAPLEVALYNTISMSYKTALKTMFDSHFEDVEAEVSAVYIKELEDYIKGIVKSSGSSSASKPSASKTVSKAASADGDKEKAVRPYAQFVKFCSQYSKAGKPLDLMVTPGDHYKKKDTKSFAFFDKNLQDIIDVEMTFDDMFQRVHGEVEPGGGAMRTAGICWGLLSKEAQDEILSTMD